jgi:DinB superfamily
MKDFLTDFQQTIESTSSRLLSIPEQQAQTARDTGKWSPKQIIGHLIDSAANNHARFVKAQMCDHLDFQGYEQDEWVNLQRYDTEPWQQLVQLWRLYNLHLIHLMSNASEETLKQSRAKHNLQQIAWKAVPQTEPATLEYFMRDYVGHLKHQLGQIFEAKQ